MGFLGSRSATEAAGFFVKGATLSNGHALVFESGDIVLVVGPNNSGKSTFLTDIKSYLRSSARPRKMLSDVSFQADLPTIQSRIEEVFHVDKSEHAWIILNQKGQYDEAVGVDAMGPGTFALAKAASAFAITLDAETRLSLSNPAETIDISIGRPIHPYHHFMLNRDTLRRFAGVIKSAFGLDFTIVRIGNPVRGYVGAGFRNDEDSLEADKDIPALGEPVERQGDGIRSYIGIAAEIIGSTYPITLLDEPEAFLHPPQARKLGRLILDTLPMDRQAFIATHSSDFLQGAISSKSSRVKVVRVDRSGSILHSNSLSNEQLLEAVSHPSIANSNLLDSLFFSQTVICEADADCGLFDWTVRELGSEDLLSTDRFWFGTGGKHQTPKIAELLATFGVDFRVILDLDAIANWELLARLCALKGIDVSSHKRRINTALSVLDRPALGAIADEIKQKLDSAQIHKESDEQDLLRNVQRTLDKGRRSHPLKQYGVDAFRRGQERDDVDNFLQILSRAGITLLRKGEIESYVPTVGLHGPGWASAVLETYEQYKPNLEHLLKDIAPGIS